jgi:hypothetical protein
MDEARDPIKSAASEICDALRYLGDVSYAVLPQNVAHDLGDLKKKFLANVRSLIDRDIEWIDARVAGGDRLREEWRSACNRHPSDEAGQPVN